MPVGPGRHALAVAGRKTGALSARAFGRRNDFRTPGPTTTTGAEIYHARQGALPEAQSSSK